MKSKEKPIFMILIKELSRKSNPWKEKNLEIWKSFLALRNLSNKDMTKSWKWKSLFLIYKIKIVPWKNKSDKWTGKMKPYMTKTMTSISWVKILIMNFFIWKKHSDKLKSDMPQLIGPWTCSKIELIKLCAESKTRTNKHVALLLTWQKLEIRSKSSDNKRLSMILIQMNFQSETHTLLIQMENLEMISISVKVTWCVLWRIMSFLATHFRSSITLMKE